MGVLSCGSIVDGHSTGATLKRLWFAPFAAPSAFPGLPAVASGVVVVGSVGGMSAFDAANGGARWNATLWSGNKASFAGNVVARNGVVCLADYFGIGCADIATGHVRWSTEEDHPTQRGESAIDDAALYYGTADHRVIARELVGGRALWSTDIAPGAQFMSRVFGVSLRGDTLYVATVRWLTLDGGTIVGDLIALDRANGNELWRYTAPSPSGFQGAPLLVGSVAILNDTYSHSLVALEMTSREVAWRTPVRADGYITAETPPVLVGDTLFSGSTDTQVYALDVRTGAYRWRVTTRAGSIGSTAVCGRLVLVLPVAGGALTVVDRAGQVADRPNVLDGDEITSRIAVSGNTAFAAGIRGLHALSCPQ
jgi:outer membrane protein assembly factor BamB